MSKTYRDLRDLLFDIEKEYSDEVGFKYKKDGKVVEVKYSQYIADVKALGEYLLNLDLKNQRIAFASPNRYEWAISYMATATSNLIVVPLDRSLPEIEYKNLLIRSEAEVFIYDKKYSEYIERLKQDEKVKVKYYINMDTELPNVLEEGRKLHNKKNNKYDKVVIDNDVMKFMLFTSGTTSASKCVMLCHKNLCENVSSIQDTLDVRKEDVFLSFLPLHHTFECTTGLLYGTSMGAKISYCEGIKHFRENLKDFGVTVFINVPAMTEGLYRTLWKGIEKENKTKKVKFALKLSNFLMKFGIDLRRTLFKEVHEALGGKIRFMVSGAAALNPTIEKTLNDMGLIIYQGYGLTETSPVLSVEKKNNMRLGSVGKAMPRIEIKTIDEDEDGIGELVVKGPNVMLGYYDDEEATKHALQDGWFRTGDLGRVDKDGYIFITGRKKDVIVLKNGKNVFPDELELLINELDFVSESIVYGVTEKDGDVNLNAKIVYNKDELKEKLGDIAEEEIREYYWNRIKTEVNKKMPNYKYIKNVIVTTEPLIKTTTNKVKRHEELKKILGK